MKQGIALFTLLLYRGEQFQSGGRSMLECILGWKESVSINDAYAEKVEGKSPKRYLGCAYMVDLSIISTRHILCI